MTLVPLLFAACLTPALTPSLVEKPAELDTLSESDALYLLQLRYARAEALARTGQDAVALDSLRSLFFDLRPARGRVDSLRWALQLATTREMARLLERTGPDPGEDEGYSSLDFQLQLHSDSLRGFGPESDEILSEVLAEAEADADPEADSLLAEVLLTVDSLVVRQEPLPDIPDCDRPEVDGMVNYFVNGRGRKFYQIWLDRYPAVAPTIQRVLAEEGMPGDLIFLAMIESGFRTTATSRAKARGPWQFITGTAHLFDLRVDYWMDERLDLERSTRAACRFLRKLYLRYDDWYLAMAAYNWGPGRIDRAVARGVTDYWSIGRMPSETRNYVPTYLAARRVFQDYARNGFILETPPAPPELELLAVDGSIRLGRLADLFAQDESQFVDWNRHLVQGSTPPDGGHIYVPAQVAGTCRDRLAQLPESAFQDWVRHKVRRGETVSAIARRYGVGAGDIRRANKLGSRARLKAGRILLIPLDTQDSEQAQVSKRAGGEGDERPTRSKAVTHRIRRGETLTSIARRHGLSVSELASANGISTKAKLRAGRTLRIPGAVADAIAQDKTARPADRERAETAKRAEVAERAEPRAQAPGALPVHRVKRGEVLNRIAKRYGLSVTELREWNQLDRTARIYPGQELLLADPDSVERVESVDLSRKEAPRPVRETGSARPAARPRASHRTHVVRAGETASAIAQHYGVPLSRLREVNKLGRLARIVTGQRLKIPGGGNEDAGGNQQVIHVVRAGESLWSLAKQYKVKVADIRRWNKLRGSDIHTGSRLVIILAEEG